MTDLPYTEALVPSAHRPLFEQLRNELPEFELWVRLEDFGRWLSVGVINRATGVAVTIPVSRAGRVRTLPFQSDELLKIRDHLNDRGAKDLELPTR